MKDIAHQLDVLIQFQEASAKVKLAELKRLKCDQHEIGALVQADREYLKHMYCYNVLKQLKEDNG